MYKQLMVLCFSLLTVLVSRVEAKIDLVTLPNRDQVQLTIYNPTDLTLVREQRTLTLKQGINRLEFSWADTLIDPTSVHLEAPQHADKVTLLEVSYPPNITGSAVWTIESQIAGEVPVEITFFTSGIRWRASYEGILSPDERTMRLQGYVRVDNDSGEEYTNAQTRVVVGKIQLLEEIAALARRTPPYGSPLFFPPAAAMYNMAAPESAERMDETVGHLRKQKASPALLAMKDAKQIVKEGLSEYFLYSIEGTETIPTKWGKRLSSLEVADIPVRFLYRYDENRYGNQLQQLLFFKNDKQHHLGETPLPDGNFMIYRQLDDNHHLSYVNTTNAQYIPLEQEVELDLGAAREVKIEPVLMNYATQNYLFNYQGNISGFEKVEDWQLRLENNRALPVDVEIFRHVEHAYWEMKNAKDLPGQYEKIDVDTFKYTLTLPAHGRVNLNYQLTLFEGERQQNH